MLELSTINLTDEVCNLNSWDSSTYLIIVNYIKCNSLFPTLNFYVGNNKRNH